MVGERWGALEAGEPARGINSQRTSFAICKAGFLSCGKLGKDFFLSGDVKNGSERCEIEETRGLL